MWPEPRYRIEYEPTVERYRVLRSRFGLWWTQLGIADEFGPLPMTYRTLEDVKACIEDDRRAQRGPQWRRVDA